MDKYSFREFLKSCSPILLLMMGIVTGLLTGLAVSIPHTDKHGCEYVEKAECKQVWIKK
jgi:hypothetical protein